MAFMDAAYILATVRDLLDEQSSVKCTDDQINKWVQEAAIDISTKTLCYEDTDVITTAANTLEYSEPSGAIKVHSCVKGGAATEWTEKHNQDYWQIGSATTWSTDKWVFTTYGGATAYILVDGSWFEDFTPTKARLTFNFMESNATFYFVDGDANIIGQSTLLDDDDEPTIEIDLDWTEGLDIAALVAIGGGTGWSVHITKIEFYGAGTVDTDYKGLSQVHPRLIQHVSHNESGEPIHFYHHHQKVGLWPLPDAAYAITAYSSKITETITDLPSELRLLAIPYCLAMARLSEGWEDDFEMFIAMYLNSVMAYRPDRGQYKLNTIDARDDFWIPDGD